MIQQPRLRILRCLRRHLSAFAGEMTVTRGNAVVGPNFVAQARRFRPRSKVELNRLPHVAGLRLKSQTGSRLISAMRHAILASRITRHAFDYSVFVPINIVEELGIGREMTTA